MNAVIHVLETKIININEGEKLHIHKWIIHLNKLRAKYQLSKRKEKHGVA